MTVKSNDCGAPLRYRFRIDFAESSINDGDSSVYRATERPEVDGYSIPRIHYARRVDFFPPDNFESEWTWRVRLYIYIYIRELIVYNHRAIRNDTNNASASHDGKRVLTTLTGTERGRKRGGGNRRKAYNMYRKYVQEKNGESFADDRASDYF